MISIFDYIEPARFLKDYIEALPRKGWGVSRRMATHLSVNTSLISLILTGRQSLSIEAAHGLTTFFGWTKLETKYFLTMVYHERAGTNDLKKYYLEEMASLKKDALKISERLTDYKGLTEEQRTLFYSSWLYSALRLYCSLGDEGKSLEEIKAKFQIPLAELRPMLEFLTQAQLVEIKNDRYHLGLSMTHLEQTSPHLSKHHTNWRLQSIQRLDRVTDSELVFTSPMSLSKEDFMKVREELVQIIKSTLATVKNSPGEMVVCMNIDWIQIATES